MNASKIKARTIVTVDDVTAHAEVTGAQLLIPAAGGAVLSLAFHLAAAGLGAEMGTRLLAALAGVSGWLYVGLGCQAQRILPLVGGLAAAGTLFIAALAAVPHGPAVVGALFLIQAAFGVAAVALRDRSPALIAWVSLNAVLGMLTVM